MATASSSGLFKMINESTSVVDEMLQGLVHTSPHLSLVPEHRVVLHQDYQAIKQNQVTLLSGGGSGHEPAHAGYIGDGMLTGVICGGVFASPSTKQVLAAIRLVAGEHGCLIIVKNYTAGVHACETAKAEGFNVDMVVIGDDVAIPGAKAGRRGVAGTVFIHKIAGAMAAQGYPLDVIANKLRQLAIGTMGVAWKSCTLPGQSTSRHINSNEMELGLGIHGEPGVRTASQKSSKDTVAELLETIHTDLGVQRHDSVVLMVNNLGSTTAMELNVIANDTLEFCRRQDLNVERIVVGNFMTALDMSGFSITVWKLDSMQQHALLAWLDFAVTAPAWPARTARPFKANQLVNAPKETTSQPAPVGTSPLTAHGLLLKQAIEAAARRIIQAEPELTEWDSKVGDGDCGHTLKGGAQAILNDLASYPLNVPSLALHAIAATIGKSIGGTSGVLYTIFFTAAGTAMQTHDKGQDNSTVSTHGWVDSFESGVAAIQKYGGALEGSRTMVDALLPALRAAKKAELGSYSDWLTSVEKAAYEGAENTKEISPRDAMGRTSYVGADFVKGVPDPGAMAVAYWIHAVVAILSATQ
ncbi:unnamed protein product [Aphanomyces euteiches]